MGNLKEKEKEGGGCGTQRFLGEQEQSKSGYTGALGRLGNPNVAYFLDNLSRILHLLVAFFLIVSQLILPLASRLGEREHE